MDFSHFYHISVYRNIFIKCALFLLYSLLFHFHLQGQFYQQDVEKILRYDTEIADSPVQSIRYCLIVDSTHITDTIHVHAPPHISPHQAIYAGNALTLFPLYLAVSLRKCSTDYALSDIPIKADGVSKKLSLKDFILHTTHFPVAPRFPGNMSSQSLSQMAYDELLALASAQNPGKFCAYSVLNSLIATYELSKIAQRSRACTAIKILDESTFAQAKKGKLSFSDMVVFTDFLLHNIDLIQAESCKTRSKVYDLYRGFYVTELEGYAMYIMTGRVPSGRILIGMVPSTMTAVILLSEGKSQEIVDYGYLILRMLNYNWEKTKYE